MTAVVRCLESERIPRRQARHIKQCTAVGKPGLILTCTEVCQVGVSEAQQSVLKRQCSLTPKAASEGDK